MINTKKILRKIICIVALLAVPFSPTGTMEHPVTTSLAAAAPSSASTPSSTVASSSAASSSSSPAVMTEEEPIKRMMTKSDDLFSGFYDIKSGTSEDYAGAYFLAKDRLIMATPYIRKILNLEGATFHVVRLQSCSSCRSFLSRDYFDFMVEHQSSTTNQAPVHPDVLTVILKRLRKKTGSLVRRAQRRRSVTADPRASLVVAAMVFSSNSAGRGPGNGQAEELQREIRRFYFESTFWSVYSHFQHVVIFTGSADDLQILLSMNLPIWAVFDLSSDLAEEAKREWDGKGTEPAPTNQHLPKYALLNTIKHLTTNSTWAFAKYIYYTEGDLILHVRSSGQLFDLVDKSQGHFTAIPHRMQTIPLVKDFPEKVRPHFDKGSPQQLPDVILVQENVTSAFGSCCDDGRFEYGDCGTW